MNSVTRDAFSSGSQFEVAAAGPRVVAYFIDKVAGGFLWALFLWTVIFLMAFLSPYLSHLTEVKVFLKDLANLIPDTAFVRFLLRALTTVLIIVSFFFVILLLNAPIAFFETATGGSSPGKWILRLQTLRLDGKVPSLWQFLLRNFLKELENFIALTAILARGDNRTVADHLVGTIVVRSTPRHPFLKTLWNSFRDSSHQKSKETMDLAKLDWLPGLSNAFWTQRDLEYTMRKAPFVKIPPENHLFWRNWKRKTLLTMSEMSSLSLEIQTGIAQYTLNGLFTHKESQAVAQLRKEHPLVALGILMKNLDDLRL